MDFIDVQLLIARCAEIGVVHPNALKLSSWAIASFIEQAIEKIQQEDIEALLTLTQKLTRLPTPDDAILITIGICERLLPGDAHLNRWFLDVLMKDAPAMLRAEMAAALRDDVLLRPCYMQ
jgi:hypothetical protein